MKLSLRVSGKLLIASLATRDYEIQELQAKIRGQLSVGKTGVSLKLSPGEILKIRSIGNSGLKITNLKVQTETHGKISYEPRTGNFQWVQKRLRVDLPRVKTSKLRLSTRLELNELRFRNKDHTNASFRIKTDKLGLEMPGRWIPRLGFHGEISLKNQRLSVHGRLVTETQKKLLDFSALHNLEKNVGTGRISSDLAFDPNANKISR